MSARVDVREREQPLSSFQLPHCFGHHYRLRVMGYVSPPKSKSQVTLSYRNCGNSLNPQTTEMSSLGYEQEVL